MHNRIHCTLPVNEYAPQSTMPTALQNYCKLCRPKSAAFVSSFSYLMTGSLQHPIALSMWRCDWNEVSGHPERITVPDPLESLHLSNSGVSIPYASSAVSFLFRGQPYAFRSSRTNNTVEKQNIETCMYEFPPSHSALWMVFLTSCWLHEPSFLFSAFPTSLFP